MKKNEAINRSMFRCIKCQYAKYEFENFCPNYRLKENNGKIVKRTVQSLQEVMMSNIAFRR